MVEPDPVLAGGGSVKPLTLSLSVSLLAGVDKARCTSQGWHGDPRNARELPGAWQLLQGRVV